MSSSPLFHVFPLIVATGRPHRIKMTWQAEYSHLQWGYSSLWHFPKELTALMVFLLSKGLLLFWPVHCVEKTPRQLTHCLSNIFNPICRGHASRSIARPSAVARAHAHNRCTCTHSNVQISTHTQARIHTHRHAPNQRNRCHFVTSSSSSWLLWVCEDESLRGNECECNVRLQGPPFSREEDIEIKLSLSGCTSLTLSLLLSQKDTGGSEAVVSQSSHLQTHNSAQYLC